LPTSRTEKGCALSLYVDLDPSPAPTPADVETRFDSLLNEAEKKAESRSFGHERKQALLRDLNRIRVWWDADFDRDGIQGVALFASSLDVLWRTLPLPEPVADGVRLSSELYLAPLLQFVGRGDGALI